MQLFFQPAIEQTQFLDMEESRHCVQVLRKKIDDIIHITGGKGTLFTGRIISSDKKKVAFEVVDTEKKTSKSFQLELAIAPTKNMDRMEWLVEKCVELGIDHIYFIKCSHSERQHLNLDRLKKKAISAMKQSIKTFLPTLHDMTTFNEVISIPVQQKFIAQVDERNRNLLISSAKSQSDARVFIGPEGDFSITEMDFAMQNGYQKVSLGKSRLRTETAGVAACHILNLVNDLN